MPQLKIKSSFPFAPKKWPFFYGYFIAACAALGLLMSAPGQTIGVSVFTDSLIETLHLSRFQLSLAYMFGTILSALFIRRAGRLLDIAGVRIVAGGSALGLGIILIYMSQIDFITGLFDHHFFASMIFVIIGFLFMRFTGQGVLTLASRTMLMRWFVNKRGRINSLVGVFTSLTFSMSPLVFEKLIHAYTWRGAWIMLAAIIGGGFTIFILFFFRDTPEDCGLQPDGYAQSTAGTTESPEEDNWTLAETLRSKTFWIFNIGLAMFSMFITAVTFHIVSIFALAGADREHAISIFLPVSILGVSLNLIAGWLADTKRFKFNLHYFLLLLVIGMLISCVGMLMLQGHGKYLLILGNGIANGLFGLLSSVAWPRYFGRKHLGEIAGYAMSYLVFFSAIGPSLFGWSFDLFHTYTTAIYICIVTFAIMAVLTLFAKQPQKIN